MLDNLNDVSEEQFNEMIISMPTVWLLNYYKILYNDNEEYTSLIEIIIDLDGGTPDDDPVIDKQIKCFNRMLAVVNVLRSRNIPIPNYQING